MDEQQDHLKGIAHISHYRHYQQWCTFFKLVPLSALNAKFWPGLAIFGYFIANLRTFWCQFFRPKPVVEKYQV